MIYGYLKKNVLSEMHDEAKTNRKHNQSIERLIEKYNDAFKDVKGIIKTLPEVPWSKMTFYVYNIQVERRDELMQWLKDQEIYTNIHFRHPCHVFEPYHNGVRHPLPITEQVSKHIVSLPSSQHLDTDQQDYIIQMKFY